MAGLISTIIAYITLIFVDKFRLTAGYVIVAALMTAALLALKMCPPGTTPVKEKVQTDDVTPADDVAVLNQDYVADLKIQYNGKMLAELKDILDHPEKYRPEAREAVRQILAEGK